MIRFISIFTLSFLILFFVVTYSQYLKKIEYLKIKKHNDFDGIAVLTGGKGRIKLGIDLFKNSNAKLIISGINKKVKKYNSIIPNELIKKESITLDKESLSTLDNALTIARWAKNNKLKKIKVITSYYHMPRSILLLKIMAPKLSFYEYPVSKEIRKNNSFTNYLYYHFFLMEEFIKYLLSHTVIIIY